MERAGALGVDVKGLRVIPVSLKQKKKPKYHNVKTVVDGIKFDSKREADRYITLKNMQRAGQIADLHLQVPFVLVPTQRINGKVIESMMKYIADFVYNLPDGRMVVEDSKGAKTRDYINKRKLMLWFHGIQIKEN